MSYHIDGKTGLFGSCAEFLTWLKEGPTANGSSGESRALAHWQADHSSDDWYGCREAPTAEKLAALCLTGWRSGGDRIQEVIDRLDVPRLPSIRRVRRRGDDGDSIEMERVYSGRLDTAWTRTVLNGPTAPRVLIVVDAIENGNMDAEKMFWRGAAATSLCASLVRAGYSVEMQSAFHSSIKLAVVVKPYNAPFTLTDAAATMACPGFFRGLGHMFQAKVEGEGIGMAVSYLKERSIDKGRAHVLCLAHHEILDMAAAQTWITAQLSKVQSLKSTHGVAA